METNFVYLYFGKLYYDRNTIVKDLRKRGADKDNELSDEYLISEAMEIGELKQVILN